MNFDRYGGRTYLLTVGCGLVTSVMRWFDKLDNPSFVLVITSSVCAFIAKSSFDEHSKTRADVQKSIAQAQANSEPPNTVEQVAK